MRKAYKPREPKLLNSDLVYLRQLCRSVLDCADEDGEIYRTAVKVYVKIGKIQALRGSL